MSWAFIDDNFPNHPKAVQAGPVAAYLFVCGVCYCRRYHTDGFIPENAVKTLGASTNPKRLIDALIESELWERAPGGFKVHDYHVIYADDEATKAEKEARHLQKREAGKKGGQASAQARAQALGKQNPSTVLEANVNECSSPMVRVGTGSVREGSILENEKNATEPNAAWLSALQKAYPPQGQADGYVVESAFFAVFVNELPRPPGEVWAEMRANLQNQIEGHQWRIKRMIPRLDRWLLTGAWKQRHDATPPSTLVNDKTIRTQISGAAFVAGGRDGAE